MRMDCFFCGGLFWGSLLVILGIIMLLRVFFNINIPVFRIVFALLFIYWGARLLLGGFSHRPARHYEPPATSRPVNTAYTTVYETTFGRRIIDLTDLSLDQGSRTSEINTVFGQTIVFISPDLPVEIRVKTAFAAARLPDGSTVSFGRYIFASRSFVPDAPHLTINASVAFGECRIEFK